MDRINGLRLSDDRINEVAPPPAPRSAAPQRDPTVPAPCPHRDRDRTVTAP